ncbi:glycosyltransferase [Thermodesulfobacteriota bacterium]
MSASSAPVLGIILKGYPRISETFISNEILHLERLGFSVHLISMRRARESFSHESVKRIRAAVDYLPEKILRHLPKLLFHNIMLAKEKPLEYTAALKTALRRFSRTKKIATVKHLLQAGYLVRFLLPGSGITHLHAHFAHSPTSVAMFASRLSGLPFSFTAHAKDIYTSDPRQLVEKIRLARFVVTCTEYNKRHLMDFNQRKAVPIHRIYHGVDPHLFSYNKNDRTISPPYKILTVARMIKKKGLPTLYRALRYLSDQGFPLQHTLIGDGEDRYEVLSLINKLEINHITRWLGVQPHEVVLDHYREAHLFVLGCEIALNGDRDGIPNVLLESMAIGVPVVTTRVSAIPELIDHGETGLLVSPGQPDKMAEAIFRLLKDDDLRKRVIPQARNRIVSEFDSHTLIEDLAALYRREAGF